MAYEILHFRDSDKILKDKNMEDDVRTTVEYVEEVLYETLYKRELFREGWKTWTGDTPER